MQVPTLDEEMALLRQGYCFIAGLDEAGRGCLAGPVVAAAVILPCTPQTDPHELLTLFEGVRDSKQMTLAARERLFKLIQREALSIGVGIGSPAYIDTHNILQATKYAMRLALQQLQPQPQALLLDAIRLKDIPLPQRDLIKGDARCLSIAAASVIAKVTRDHLMVELHQHYPDYGFAQHKGYGTRAHLEALQLYGVTPHHRMSFAPVREQFSLFPDLQ